MNTKSRDGQFNSM